MQRGFACFGGVARACNHGFALHHRREDCQLVALRIVRQQRKHRRTLHDFHKGKIQFVQLADEVFVACHGVVKRDTCVGVQRADFDADAFAADGCNQRVHHVQRKTGFVGEAAAVFVLAQVGGIGEELLRQVAVGGVQLYAVKACGNGVFRGLGVVSDDLADFGGVQLARGFVVFRLAR